VTKILLIDDDPSISQLLTQELVKKGYTPSSANNGKKGIEMAKIEQPHCIILDQILPDLLGIQVLQAIKTDNITRHIPVIFYTGFNDDEIKIMAQQLGAVRFLLKFSTDVPTLVSLVHDVL